MRRNNVVGCFADCQPRSGILLSTPLGLTATGTARRGKSPLIWSWKERGKVILGCLRRWVIPPQSLARTRGCSSGSGRQVAAPRRAWGDGQLVNNRQDPVPQGGYRPGWGWTPSVSARGRRCRGRSWTAEEGKGREEPSALFCERVKLPRRAWVAGCDFAWWTSREPLESALWQAGICFKVSHAGAGDSNLWTCINKAPYAVGLCTSWEILAHPSPSAFSPPPAPPLLSSLSLSLGGVKRPTLLLEEGGGVFK